MSFALPIIRLQGIVNQFGEQIVHDNLDLEIHEGEIIGIIGGSGSGKSVLVRTILGLNEPQSGHVFIGEQDITALSTEDMLALQKQWGVMFQQGALFSSLSVLENVEMPILEHMDVSDDLRREIAEVKIHLAGLPAEAGAKYPAQLSGGMIKRAALARALALDPKILFLDEPTAGLDPIAASAFDELIGSLQRILGLTVVMITHDLDTIAAVCDRVAVIVDKKVIVDTFEGIMRSDHPWVREYFHGSRMRAAMNAKEKRASDKE
jgi:phospholipid/cholesterol/gamma-HCH transport system ATP-binding protein